MIGTVLAPSASGQSTGTAARWTDEQDGGPEQHLGEQDVRVVRAANADEPAIFGVAERPVAGLRAVVTWLVRGGIPLLPRGPRAVAQRGPGMVKVGKTPKPVTAVQQFVPVPSSDQTGDWYSFLA